MTGPADSGVPASLDKVRQVAEADPALLVLLVQRFLDDGREQLDLVSAAVREERADAVAFGAHRLRGGAVLFNADRFAALAETLERSAEKGDLTQAAMLVAKLGEEFHIVCRHLATQAARPNPAGTPADL